MPCLQLVVSVCDASPNLDRCHVALGSKRSHSVRDELHRSVAMMVLDQNGATPKLAVRLEAVKVHAGDARTHWRILPGVFDRLLLLVGRPISASRLIASGRLS